MWAAVPPDIRGYVKKVIKGSLHGFFLLHSLRAFDEQNPIFFYFDNFQTPTQAEESLKKRNLSDQNVTLAIKARL